MGSSLISNRDHPQVKAILRRGGTVWHHHDSAPDVTISCACDGPFEQRVIRFKEFGAVGVCRACKRRLTIRQLTFDGETGQIHLEIVPLV